MIWKNGQFPKQAKNHEIINIDKLDFIQKIMHWKRNHNKVFFLEATNCEKKYCAHNLHNISFQDIYIISTDQLERDKQFNKIWAMKIKDNSLRKKI